MRPTFPHSSARLIVTMLVLALAAALVPLRAQGPRERTMFVSAVNAQGEPVAGLGPDDFIIREDGNAREVLRVSRAIEPIDIAILVDNSAASEGVMPRVREGLTAFVGAMTKGNQIALVAIADRPTILVDYTQSLTRLRDGIGLLWPKSQAGSTLLDAVYEVSRGLARRDAPRALMVLVITDGGDFANRQFPQSRPRSQTGQRRDSCHHHRQLRGDERRRGPKPRPPAFGDDAGQWRPAREPPDADFGAACARTTGPGAFVSVQGGLWAARLADSSGEDRGERPAVRSDHARRVGAGSGDCQMKRIVLVGAVVFAGLASTLLAQGTFRAAIDIVSLNVTVMDASGHYVTDLDEKDFSVFEDGVKQDLSFFTRKQQAIALSMLLDSSASMEDKLSTLQTAAVNFVRRLKPNDLAQVVDFDSRVEIRQTFTSNQGELESAIQKTSAGGSTSLYNAIYISLKELAKMRVVGEEDVRRQALVALLGRRRHVEPDFLRRGPRARQAQRDGHLHDRAARRRNAEQGLP